MRMKHLLLTLLLAVLVPWAVKGQTLMLFSEDFEGGSMPTGWTQECINGNVSWSVGTGDFAVATGAGQGNYNAKIQTNTRDYKTRLISPVIDLSHVGSAQLSFMHIERSWGGDIDELRVYYRTSSTGNWTLIPGQEYTAEVATWTREDEIILPNISSTYQIAFEFTSNYGYGVGLDDISIEPAASCLRPVGLTCTNINATAAALSWTEKGSATNWVIQCCIDPSFMCGNAGIINVSGTPSYTLTCLEPVTTYYVRVKASCGDNNESYWSNAISFTTTSPLPPIVVGNGWGDNFEGTECGWQLINCNLKNQWILGTATNNGGNKSLYISKDNGATNSYDFGESATVYAAKLFQFDTEQYVFSFDYKVKGEKNYDFLRVALVPDSVTLASSTGLPTGLDENNLPAGWIPLDGGSQLYSTSTTPTWTTKESTCTPEAGNYYVVFIWRNDSSVDGNPPAAIDNFSITLGCRPTWTGSGSSYYISNFTASCSGMTLLDNASTGTENTTTNYYDTKSITVEPGDELSCTITMSSGTESFGFALWVDLDGDGLEQTETMFATSSQQQSSYTGTFTIPANTPTGEYRLRILGDYNTTTPSEPCGSYQYGEAEDYKLIVACSMPTGLTVADGYPTTHSVSFTWDYEAGDVFDYSLPVDCVTNPESVPWNSIWYAGEDFPAWNNLQPNKDYSFWLRRKCSDDSFSSPVCVFFHTLQIPVEVPFSDNFENGNDWRLLNGSQTNQWAWGTAPDNGENHSLYISNDGGEHNTYTDSAPSIVYATKLFSFAESGYYSFAYTWKNHGEGLTDTGAPTPFDYLRVVLAPSTVELTPGELPTNMNAYSLPEGWIALDGGHCLSGQDEWMLNYEETYLEAGVYTMVLVWRNDGSGGYNPAVVDDVSISSVSCPGLTGLVVDTVTNDYVAFTFNSEIGAVYQYCIVDANSNVYEYMFESNTTSPATGTEYYVSYPLNGFNLQTEYGIYVRKKCGENDYSVLATTSFTTLNHCATTPIASLPYTENFDSYNAPHEGISPHLMPECWSYINTSSDQTLNGCGNVDYPAILYGNSHSSDNHLELMCESYFIPNYITFDAQPQYAILPPIENVNLTKMTLWARADNTLYDPEHPSWYHYDATFKVGVMTDPDDASTFTEVAQFTPTSTNYEQYTLYFAGYSGNGSYIAIKIEPYEAVNQAETYIRSVFIDDVIVEKPCPMPTDFAASNITASTAYLSWSGTSYVDAFDVRYRTAAEYGTPVFTEGFENGLGGWTFSSENESNGLNGVEATRAGIFPVAKHTGDYGFRFSSFQSINNGETFWQHLTSPEFTLSEPGMLKFYYRKTTQYEENLYVGYKNANNEEVYLSDVILPTEEWQLYTLELPVDAKKVFFDYFGNFTHYVYLDDITISPLVQPAGEWQYVENIGAWSTTLNGLTPETAYEAQVKSDCSNDWSDAITFTTATCPAPTNLAASNITAHTADLSWNGSSLMDSYDVRYRTAEAVYEVPSLSEGFEYGLGNWTFTSMNVVNGIGGNGMYPAGIVDVAAHNSSYGFRFSSYSSKSSGETYDQYLVSPELTVTGELKFYAKHHDAGDNVYVGYSTTTNDLDDFTWDETALELNTSWQEFTHELPDNVKYVAFHYFGDCKYYAFVDDITISHEVTHPVGDWHYKNIDTLGTTLDELLSGTIYDVEVKSDCSDDWSEAVSFTTESCPAVTNLVVTEVGSDHVILNWAGQSDSGWRVYYTDENNQRYYQVALERPYKVINLDNDMHYDIEVSSECNVVNSNPFEPNLVATTEVTTFCTAPTNVTVSDILHTSATVSWTGTSDSYNVSYRESAGDFVLFSQDFEEYGLSLWTFTSMNAANDFGPYYGASVIYDARHDGSYGLRFSSHDAIESTETYDQYLFSPELSTTGTLKFYFKKPYSYAASLSVGYSTTTNDLDAFTWSDTPVPTYEWQEYTQGLPADVKYLAFHYCGARYGYVYLDDITIGVYGVSAGDWQTVPTTNGANSVTLTGLTIETQYDVKVQAACGEESDEVVFTTLSHDLMLFVHDGYWNNPDNWIPVGLPTVNQDVELRADVTIPSGYLATANHVYGTDYMEHVLTIENGGQLYHTNYVYAEVKKTVIGYGLENHDTNNGYILLAHPIWESIGVGGANDYTNVRSGIYDLYNWNRLGDDEGHEWINYGPSNPSSMMMKAETGYLYANQEDTEMTFRGGIRGNANGNPINYLGYTAPTNEHMFSAWHLIGSPFVCDAYLVSAKTNGIALPYYKMNSEGNGLIAVITGESIAPMEGVFYEVPTDAPNFGVSVYFSRTQPSHSNNLNLNIRLAQGSTTLDNVIIRFDEGQTMGKLSFREGSSKVYIPVEGKDYAVFNAGQSGEIPVSFEAETNGTYTLSFNTEGVAFSYLHLIDNLTGTDVDLLALRQAQEPASYTFEAQSTDDARRFKLAFSLVDGGMGNWASNTSEPGGLRDTNTTPLVPKHALTGNQDASVFTQVIALATGWNWWAPVVQITAAQLNEALNGCLQQILSKDGAIQLDSEADLVLGQMYKLQTNTTVEDVTLTGDFHSVNISIAPNANWIGYTGTTASIATALGSNFTPANGDKIISQDGGFAIYNGTSWQGTLTQLTHGQGYVYFSKDTETKPLSF